MSWSRRVRKDCHGLYVRTGGYVFRPVPDGKLHAPEVVEGEVVTARHMGNSELAIVGVEYWHSHGTYFRRDGSLIPSDLVWKGAPMP